MGGRIYPASAVVAGKIARRIRPQAPPRKWQEHDRKRLSEAQQRNEQAFRSVCTPKTSGIHTLSTGLLGRWVTPSRWGLERCIYRMYGRHDCANRLQKDVFCETGDIEFVLRCLPMSPHSNSHIGSMQSAGQGSTLEKFVGTLATTLCDTKPPVRLLSDSNAGTMPK